VGRERGGDDLGHGPLPVRLVSGTDYRYGYYNDAAMSAKPLVLEFGMGVDVHGLDATTAACRAVSDAIRHSSLPLLQEVRERGGRMLVAVTVGVPEPASVTRSA